MISLLLPFGLTALAALAVPLVVHFIRRTDRHRVSFAAMRWLGEQPHPREKLRLHERWLLVLRMLLIAALALWLSLPVWRGPSEPQSPWILVAPGLDAASARSSVAAPGEWHWLAPGFPALGAAPITPAARPDESLTSLVREIDSRLSPGTALTLVVSQRSRGSRRRTAATVTLRDVACAPGGEPGIRDRERGHNNAHARGPATILRIPASFRSSERWPRPGRRTEDPSRWTSHRATNPCLGCRPG